MTVEAKATALLRQRSRPGVVLPTVRRPVALRKVATKRQSVARKRGRRKAFGSYRAPSGTVWLDRPLSSDSATTVGELMAAPLGLADPYTYMEAQLLNSLVGDLSIDQIEKLDDLSLRHLQEKLREAGFGPRGIQSKERDRLRMPARHRGYASAQTWQPLGKKRHDRKPRPAWDGVLRADLLGQIAGDEWIRAERACERLMGWTK